LCGSEEYVGGESKCVCGSRARVGVKSTWGGGASGVGGHESVCAGGYSSREEYVHERRGGELGCGNKPVWKGTLRPESTCVAGYSSREEYVEIHVARRLLEPRPHHTTFPSSPHETSQKPLIYERLSGLLTFSRKPGNSDDTRIHAYIWDLGLPTVSMARLRTGVIHTGLRARLD